MPKKRIQDSKKRALLKAKELRLFKAIENAELARMKSRKRGASESMKIHSAIKSLRSMEHAVIMLDARIERVKEVLERAKSKEKTGATIKLEGDLYRCQEQKKFFSKQIKEAKKVVSEELSK